MSDFNIVLLVAFLWLLGGFVGAVLYARFADDLDLSDPDPVIGTVVMLLWPLLLFVAAFVLLGAIAFGLGEIWARRGQLD